MNEAFQPLERIRPRGVSENDDGSLREAIYEALRRGRSYADIWRTISLELLDTLERKSGSGIVKKRNKKEKEEAKRLAPYCANLVVDIYNQVAADGGKITLEYLKLASVSPEINVYLNPPA